MSSFASRAREEIAARSIQKDCCVRAAAYGIACFAKYFDAKGLVLQTEQRQTAAAAQQLFARCGVQGEIFEKQRPSGILYEFNIRAPEQVARMHELFGTTGSETSLQIDPRLIRCQTCVSAYIGAAFLCSGTVIDPQKEYNLEFLTPRTNLARDFEALLAEHEFAPHRTRRNGINLIYVKASANVERLLRFMGAAAAPALHGEVVDLIHFRQDGTHLIHRHAGGQQRLVGIAQDDLGNLDRLFGHDCHLSLSSWKPERHRS